MKVLERESERIAGAGKPLLTSPQQVSRFLFEELKLPVPAAAASIGSSTSTTGGGRHLRRPGSASSTRKNPVVPVSTSDEILQVRNS